MNWSAAAVCLSFSLAAQAAVVQTANAVPGKYIVVLKEGAARGGEESPLAGPSVLEAANALTLSYGGALTRVYEHALKGFAVDATALQAHLLSLDPRVAFVEQDSLVSTTATQNNATWGLDRIDQRTLPLDNRFTSNATGAGVTAYIIDTGIRATHAEFQGRVGKGFNAMTGFGPTDDCNGHGTHVAGTVGGATYGVAKEVTLIPVLVLGCGGVGLNSQVIAGVDWVTQHHQPGQPAVANMSLGGGASAALDAAVKNSIADGVSYAVAAGNDNANACTSSPARIPEAMTSGASTITDAAASFSNWGSCVDWYAPGANITSAWWLSNTSTNTISGTSMASPHTAGVAALYLQLNPGATPAEVQEALRAGATQNIVTGASVNNHLLFTPY